MHFCQDRSFQIHSLFTLLFFLSLSIYLPMKKIDITNCYYSKPHTRGSCMILCFKRHQVSNNMLNQLLDEHCYNDHSSRYGFFFFFFFFFNQKIMIFLLFFHENMSTTTLCFCWEICKKIMSIPPLIWSYDVPSDVCPVKTHIWMHIHTVK